MEEMNNQEVSVSLSVPDLKNLAGWATFSGVMNIIGGALCCLGFILILPAVFGVLRIIAGVKTLNAADDMKRYMATNDTAKLADTFVSLNKSFKLRGISLIIYICLLILVLILYGVMISWVMTNYGDIIKNAPYQFNQGS